MKRTLSISLIILILSSIFPLEAQNKKTIANKKTPVSLDSLVFKKLTNRLEIGFNNPAQYAADKSSTYFNGLKVGLTTEYPLKNNLSLLAGVLYNLVYSDKQQKFPNSTSAEYLSYGHYINVPVHLIYNLPISNDLKFNAFAGPTLNFGISQTQGIISTYSVISTTYTPDMYKSNLNQLDLQLGLGLGVQWKKYQLKGGYDWGLINISKSASIGNLYQKGWYVSLSVTL
ncbi:MAG: outer membrane beta-barrel protein [Paludibacter sp.]